MFTQATTRQISRKLAFTLIAEVTGSKKWEEGSQGAPQKSQGRPPSPLCPTFWRPLVLTWLAQRRKVTSHAVTVHLSYDKNGTTVFRTTRASAHSHQLARFTACEQGLLPLPQTEIALGVKVMLSRWIALTHLRNLSDSGYNGIPVWCLTVGQFF